MHAWKAIEQSLAFIEENLTEEISTEELANTAGLSPFYFQRLFPRATSQAGMLACTFGDCREGQIPRCSVALQI